MSARRSRGDAYATIFCVNDLVAKRLEAYVDSKSLNFNCPKCGTTIRANATLRASCSGPLAKALIAQTRLASALCTGAENQ